jgi:MinD-like ATPase involved in chromosome partitioning or flagellar assembly
VSVAAELARRRRRVVLADLDPWGGSVAQHLGVLDEVSGLLAAARLANAGELDRRRFAATRRMVGERLEVLTGLPAPTAGRRCATAWPAEILERAAEGADVVVDTGFALEDAESDFGRPGAGRNRMTLEALRAADEVLVSAPPTRWADPSGARAGRAGGDAPAGQLRVVVNRMRDSLGWAERDIRGMVEASSAGGRALPARRPRRVRPRAGRRAGGSRVRGLGAASRPR